VKQLRVPAPHRDAKRGVRRQQVRPRDGPHGALELAKVAGLEAGHVNPGVEAETAPEEQACEPGPVGPHLDATGLGDAARHPERAELVGHERFEAGRAGDEGGQLAAAGVGQRRVGHGGPRRRKKPAGCGCPARRGSRSGRTARKRRGDARGGDGWGATRREPVASPAAARYRGSMGCGEPSPSPAARAGIGADGGGAEEPGTVRRGLGRCLGWGLRVAALGALYASAGFAAVAMVGASVVVPGALMFELLERAPLSTGPTILIGLPSFLALFVAMSVLLRTVHRAESILLARGARSLEREPAPARVRERAGGQLSVAPAEREARGRLSMTHDAPPRAFWPALAGTVAVTENSSCAIDDRWHAEASSPSKPTGTTPSTTTRAWLTSRGRLLSYDGKRSR